MIEGHEMEEITSVMSDTKPADTNTKIFLYSFSIQLHISQSLTANFSIEYFQVVLPGDGVR